MTTSIGIGELKGRQVISVAEGARLGTVEDLLFSGDRRAVTHLLVGSGQALAFAKIKKVGPDAVMVETRSDLEPIPAESVLKFSEVCKLPAMSTDGANLGSLAELTFDLSAGQIVTAEVRSGGVLGIGQQKSVFSIDKVRSFGEDAVTIEVATPTVAQ